MDAGPASTVGNLAFSSLATVNLRLFADLDQRKELVAKAPLLKGVRISLGLSNLFDQRQNVRDASGATPIGFQPANLDPIGRTVRLSLRKLLP